ncbi:MAG: hypothetical protein M1540_09905 [Candidatus Bathyarchaeota archaeon]|nr:hypothetical protein [Chloroflexota bacterium]MCL5878111.1 hypothetical protein [Candidatus Bathyarchaeota archaeon]
MLQNPISQEDITLGDDMDWNQENEFWNSYRLNDGTLLKVKLVLKGVKRLKKFNADGTPIYMIMADNVVRTTEIQGNVRLKLKPPNMAPV